MRDIILALLGIIGSLGFFLLRKSRENTNLRSKIDLTEQSERSKIVDEKVSSADVEIDALREEMDKPVGSGFWKKYTKK